MSNRFLFLEKELKGFDVKTANKEPRKFVTSKSTYSRQQNPAVIVAATGVGWKVFEFVAAQTPGDISVKLSRMEGAKYPNDDKAKYKNKGIWKTQTQTVYQKVTNYIGDEISATIGIRFKYNGSGVADIDMDLTKSNDAVGWGLKVETKMMPSRNNYISNKGGQLMSMVEITANYRFTRSIGSDIIKIKRYKLYGDGTVI